MKGPITGFLGSGGISANASNTWTADQTFNDDIELQFGTTSGEQTVFVHSSAAVAADVEVTGIIEGTSDHQGFAVDSMVISNIANDGDLMMLVSDGGNSLEFLLANADVADLQLGHGMATVTLKTASGTLTLDPGDGLISVPNGDGVVIGHDSSVSISGVAATLQVMGNAEDEAAFNIGRFQSLVGGPQILLAHSRNGTIGSNTILQDNDEVGKITGVASDGANLGTIIAEIIMEVDDSSPEADSIGGALVFRTAAGAGTDDITEVMRINNAGEVGIGVAPITGSKLSLPQEDDNVTPTLSFGSGTGFYESTDNVLNVTVGGSSGWNWIGAAYRATNSNGPGMISQPASATTVTIFPNRSDDDTGLGQAAANQLSLIAGSDEGIRVTNSDITGSGEIGISLGGGAAVDGAAFAFNNLTDRTFITSVGSQFHMPAQTSNFDNGSGTIAVAPGTFFGIPTWTGDTATLTMTDPATVVIEGAPVASTNVAFTNTAKAFRVVAGASQFGGRLLETQGADVASTNNLVLGVDGNTFEITGTTDINLLSNIGWQNGAVITLMFTSTATVKDAQATSTTNITILLDGSADFDPTAGDTITLRLGEIGGTQAWREMGRTVL